MRGWLTSSQWKQDASQREIRVMHKYHIQDREDYHKYNKICGNLRSLIHRISLLPANDPYRQKKEAEMLDKLYDMGILDVGAKPSDIENKVTVSSIARRRLAVVATRLKMAESVSDAVRTIEQGHIRVGPSPVTDPAMLITRHMEDFVTWVDTSARKRTIMKYNDEVSRSRDEYGLIFLARRLRPHVDVVLSSFLCSLRCARSLLYHYLASSRYGSISMNLLHHIILHGYDKGRKWRSPHLHSRRYVRC